MKGFTVHVLDIGTHDAQEVSWITGRHSFISLLIHLAHHVRMNRKLSLREFIRVVRASYRIGRRSEFRLVCIEPVFSKTLFHRLKYIRPEVLLKGVASSVDQSVVKLNLANNRLGNSIFNSKPGLTGETVLCENYSFDFLFKGLIIPYFKPGDCLILRVNAEGIEKDLIDYIESSGVKIDLIAGSLGDIKKCFGKDAYQASVKQLGDLSIPFVYFTSSPLSWHKGLLEIERTIEIKNQTNAVDDD